MAYPPLLELPGAAEYRAQFEATYCRGPFRAFDGIEVRFRKRDFDHCCFESSRRDGAKDAFSQPRAKRLEWIKAALPDPGRECYEGVGTEGKRAEGGRAGAGAEAGGAFVCATSGEGGGVQAADLRLAFGFKGNHGAVAN